MATHISEAKLEANRRNAGRSTGPRTEAGKKKVRWNALKHGLTAKTTLVPGLEDPKEYRKLRKGFLKAFKPKGAVEASLVQELAACRLKVMRGFRAERNELAVAADTAREQFLEEEFEDDEQSVAKAEKKARKRDFFRIDESVESLGRYQTTARRHFQAILTMLFALQREREKKKERAKNTREKK